MPSCKGSLRWAGYGTQAEEGWEIGDVSDMVAVAAAEIHSAAAVDTTTTNRRAVLAGPPQPGIAARSIRP